MMFSKEIYVGRRERLSQALKGEFLLFLGNRNTAINYPSNEYSFRQDSTFLYLFGIEEPDFAAVMADGKTTIYADDVDMDDIIWMGPQESVADKAAKTGVTLCKKRKALASDVANAIKSGRKIHFVPPYRGETAIELAELTGMTISQIKKSYSVKLIKSLVALRSVKDGSEIMAIENCQAVGYKMHVKAMKMALEGRTENEIRASIEYKSMLSGGRLAFPTICSVSGQTLHNHSYDNTLRNGQLLLVDAGNESQFHYASDHTRTTPVGGRFSQQQKEIYQIVLDANNAVIANSKPGVKYLDMHLLASRTIADGLISLGLMKGSADDAVARGVHALFFPHGIGHMMGLDVHDMENYGEDLVGYDNEVSRSSQFGLSSLRFGRQLQPGFVLTVEPGIYFIPELIDKWQAEGLFNDIINYDLLKQYRTFGGIRLEDDIIVTNTSCRLLGKRIPISIDKIEAML